MIRSVLTISTVLLGGSLLLSLAMPSASMAQPDLSATTSQSKPVRAMTIQDARREAREVFGPQHMQRTFEHQHTSRRKNIDDFVTRAQRERNAKRQAEKCAKAIERLEAIRTEDGKSDPPVPFACR